ncbi:MAG: N-6 DNA methylase, partial [bacterium]
TNVCICFFERKKIPGHQPMTFTAVKIDTKTQLKTYHLFADNYYRAGSEFDEFVEKYKSASPLEISFYLTIEEVKENKGSKPVKLIDANSYANGCFRFNVYEVNDKLYEKLCNNPLFVRTLDTGSWSGRAGIYDVRKTFGVDGIVVTKEKYRTHPIQIFFFPELSPNDLILLKDYFNLMLEYFRNITDSEFLTTFKYSNSEYIRKYLGLSQTKKLLLTLPIHRMAQKEKKELGILIDQKNIEGIKALLLHLRMDNRGQLEIF